MRTHILIAALLTASALLAACGGDPSANAGSAADRKQQMQDAALEYARCMREHGVDMPDPKPGGAGIQLSAPRGVSEQKMRAADDACRKYLEKVKPPEMSDEQQKEFREAALAHARCMREHGLDFPDPTFGENGQARIQLGKGKSGLNPNDPKFQEAQKACQSKMPQIRGGEGASTSESSP